MESLAECLAAQEEIHGKYESLLLRVEDDFKDKLTRLKDLAIHSLEETAVSIESDVEPITSGYPQVFNYVYQFIDGGEDITDEGLSELTEEEILFLVSLLNCLPNNSQVINHIFKFSVFNHQTDVENSLKANYPTLSFNPEWLIDAALLQDVELVRKFSLMAPPQEIVKKAISHANKSSEIYSILDDLIKLDEIRSFAWAYNLARQMAGLTSLAYSN